MTVMHCKRVKVHGYHGNRHYAMFYASVQCISTVWLYVRDHEELGFIAKNHPKMGFLHYRLAGIAKLKNVYKVTQTIPTSFYNKILCLTHLIMTD